MLRKTQMAKRKEQEPDIVEPLVWSAEPKDIDVTAGGVHVVALIAAHRAAQAKEAVYRVEGEELTVYVGGTKIGKALMPTGEKDAKVARAKAQAILEPVVKKYGELGEADILKITATEDKFTILSKDGRKYSIDLKTGKVT